MTSHSQILEDTDANTARAFLMRICAQATMQELEAAVGAMHIGGPVQDIRPTEQGLVMVQGRTGGDGQPFNIGEASVTRSAVRLADGTVGFSYILGRDVARARLAAIVDALGQSPEIRQQLDHLLVMPVTERCHATRQARESQTAATRVEFFTLVRGED
jgi:alpha-D-ribose 1-methylphosphonate 5-triphosphate synthase subunit PhnG